MKINELVGRDVIFYIGKDPVTVNIEDMNSKGFTCTVLESKSHWYNKDDVHYIPIETFILQVINPPPKSNGAEGFFKTILNKIKCNAKKNL